MDEYVCNSPVSFTTSARNMKFSRSTQLPKFFKLIFPLLCSVQKSVDRSWLSVAVELVALSSEEGREGGNPMAWVYGSALEGD